MRNIPREMIIDSVDAGVGAVIDLFELDLTPLGGEVIASIPARTAITARLSGRE
ncbi:Uncharacterised protein [Escherichia coli]|uniref:Uncharacterized protein n=1 Tax=Escherichia coli TaxID=562 RepID=A0A376LPP8_ECOLX|nr:Uncharacterised protein [Escherichia coli]